MTGQLIAFVGIPASGKTTIRNDLVKRDKIDEVISPDEIRFYDFETQFDPKLEPLVWSIAKARIGRCLSQDKKCLLDCTNIDPRLREDLLVIAKDFGARTKSIALNIDFDIAYNRNKRTPIPINGSFVGQTVPDYAMFRMRSQWDTSGLGHTNESIKRALEKEFDEVEIINRFADKKDCKELNGKITTAPNGKKACLVTYEDDVSYTKKYYYV